MFAVVAVIGMGFGLHLAMAEQDESGEDEKDGIQILSHGPIHEAFAETVAFDPQPGAMVSKEPPPSIEEIPPEQKPEGDVQWVPGYWAWDDERSDFIWVSGVWRIPPPGRQWVPGYWAESGQEFQWTSGYWITIKASEAEYLPEPPDSVELGPNTNAPSSDYGWIPGCWIWHHSRYAWRPGYWAKMQPNWVWVPAHYSWTPRGYIFVGGYWDFVVVNRGVLYAPVYVTPDVYTGVVFSFTPGFVVDLNIFSDCLFIRPGYRHYYFGNFYAPRYYRKGIYPWFSLHARRSGYDPIYAHQRWNHRNDNNWEHHLTARFKERRDHKEMRPSRRPDLGKGQGRDWNKSPRTSNVAAVRFSPVRKSIDSPVRLKPMNEKERKEIYQSEKAVRTYRKDRQERETREIKKPMPRSLGKIEPSRKAEPYRAKIGRSPITARPVDRTGLKNTPPYRYKPPRPDPNVEPLGRTSDAQRAWGRGNPSSEARGRNAVTGAQSNSAKDRGRTTSGKRGITERK
jgi:hypothetical protein